MFLEEFTPGRVDVLGPIEVDEAEVIAFGRRFDPQAFHIDPEAARTGPFGGIIASGWHTCAMLMREVVDHYLDPRASLGSPGVDELRWVAPVRPGDRLIANLTVLNARASKSKPDRGVVQSAVVMRNQDDMVVLTMTSTFMVRRRES